MNTRNNKFPFPSASFVAGALAMLSPALSSAGQYDYPVHDNQPPSASNIHTGDYGTGQGNYQGSYSSNYGTGQGNYQGSYTGDYGTGQGNYHGPHSQYGSEGSNANPYKIANAFYAITHTDGVEHILKKETYSSSLGEISADKVLASWSLQSEYNTADFIQPFATVNPSLSIKDSNGLIVLNRNGSAFIDSINNESLNGKVPNPFATVSEENILKAKYHGQDIKAHTSPSVRINGGSLYLVSRFADNDSSSIQFAPGSTISLTGSSSQSTNPSAKSTLVLHSGSKGTNLNMLPGNNVSLEYSRLKQVFGLKTTPFTYELKENTHIEYEKEQDQLSNANLSVDGSFFASLSSGNTTARGRWDLKNGGAIYIGNSKTLTRNGGLVTSGELSLNDDAPSDKTNVLIVDGYCNDADVDFNTKNTNIFLNIKSGTFGGRVAESASVNINLGEQAVWLKRGQEEVAHFDEVSGTGLIDFDGFESVKIEKLVSTKDFEKSANDALRPLVPAALSINNRPLSPNNFTVTNAQNSRPIGFLMTLNPADAREKFTISSRSSSASAALVLRNFGETVKTLQQKPETPLIVGEVQEPNNADKYILRTVEDFNGGGLIYSDRLITTAEGQKIKVILNNSPKTSNTERLLFQAIPSEVYDLTRALITDDAYLVRNGFSAIQSNPAQNQRVWMRLDKGRLERKNSYLIRPTTFELGFDFTNIDSTETLSLLYSKGSSEYKTKGQGSMAAYLLNLYHTHKLENGGFFDAKVHFGRIKSNFSFSAMKRPYGCPSCYSSDTLNHDFLLVQGKTDSKIIATGLEYGQQFDYGERLKIVPHAQVEYVMLKTSDYQTNRGAHIKTNPINMLITRLGSRVGYKAGADVWTFADVSVEHDFMGRIHTLGVDDSTGASAHKRDLKQSATVFHTSLGVLFKRDQFEFDLKTSNAFGKGLKNGPSIETNLRYNF